MAIQNFNIQELSNQDDDSILKATGVPAVFVDLLKQATKDNNNAFAIRAGSPFQRYFMPNAPKPVTMKAKTGNWGAVKGVIPEDNALGKVENHDGIMVVKARDDKKDLPQVPGIVEPVTHKLSLREVIDGVARHEFELKSVKNGKLIFTANDGPTNSNIEFSINLHEKAPRVERQIELQNMDQISKNIADVKQPKWWREELGDFKKLIDNYYPAQYRDANESRSEFRDINVFGVPKGDGPDKVVLPITGDQDLLWVTRPTTKENMIEPPKVYNTFKQDQVGELIAARFDMAVAEAGDDMEKLTQLVDIDNASIARLGCVTAYESKIIDQVNSKMRGEVQHMLDLFQHGTENHNPGTPSPLDSPMIHVWKGVLSITHNEKDLVDYVLQPGYLTANIVDIHPKWDMEKWSPVIEKQVKLGHPIPEATLAACVEYKMGLKQSVPEKMLELYIAPEMDRPRTLKQSSTAMMAGLLGGNGSNAKKILESPSATNENRFDGTEKPTPIANSVQRQITQVDPKVMNEPESPSPTKRYR